MKVQPLKKRVLIGENKVEVKSVSGIILDDAKSVRESRRGTVLAIGPQVTAVKVDDVVLLDWTKGAIVKIGDAQRVLIEEEHIVAVFED